MNPAQAQYRAGTVSGIAQTCGLVFAPLAGLILDRLNRVFGNVAALSLSLLFSSPLQFVFSPVTYTLM